MRSEVRGLSIRLAKTAATYERVHYIGYTAWQPKATADLFWEKAGELLDEIVARTGYIAYLRDIKIYTWAGSPIMAVDFVIDSPSESPIIAATVTAILLALAKVFVAVAIIGAIIWLFWTTWIEKEKKYVCEQCPEFPSFDGWAAYLGHLAEKHPTKYEAAKAVKPSWEKILEAAPAIILLFLALALIERAPKPERRE